MNNRYIPHGRDLRKGRRSIPNQVYLVTTVTYQRQRVFENFPVARMLIACLRKQHEQGSVKSLAFVVMPDHLHWLFALTEVLTLSALMKRIKGDSAHTIRECCLKHNIALHKKALWQPGFYDRALRKDEDLQDAARYIVANPLRAGLVTHIGDYPWWDATWL